MSAQLTARHAAIDSMTIAAEAFGLGSPCSQHLLTHSLAGGSFLLGRQFLIRHGGHFNMQINAVQKRATNSAHVSLDGKRRTFALPLGVAKEPAGAWVKRRDEDETGGECRRVQGPRDGDFAFFERLPQDFQTTAIELWQFVEKQDAMMRHADLARGRHGAATDHAGVADGMVRRAKRSLSEQRFVLAETPHRVIVSKGPLADQIRLHDNQTGEGFLPQPAILPMVDLVITHGGNNTVTEAFHHGKPMIVLPLFWDQVDNAQRVDETGFGKRLSTYGFKARELTGAIDKLLRDRSLAERMAAMSARIKSTSGTVRAADLVERVATTGEPVTA